eukprot:CAMPEP_0113892254 /NCGR_PEP_ID=MMETSP0780_2-20120614/15298_1 /TAXON_ID=652834 /ORGANISM="Palpitomonas bilix" /LENGTH=147 /DNA_ID=CAMNT_0000882139 /DNA_START=295 /DNA_END=738 /DNA_ORIENTATION=+ /assembly_acc=CAM_ASM_000599
MVIPIHQAGVVSVDFVEIEHCDVPSTEALRLVHISKGSIHMELLMNIGVDKGKEEDSYETGMFLDAELVVVGTHRGVYDTHPFCNISFQESWELSHIRKDLKTIFANETFKNEWEKEITKNTSGTPFEDKDVAQDILSFLMQLPTCD